MYISIADLMLVTFVLVDNWYQRKGARWLGRTIGSKPEFSDSEMLTLMLAIDFFGLPANGVLWNSSAPTIWPCFPSYSIRASTIGARVVCDTCWTRSGKSGLPSWASSLNDPFCLIRRPSSLSALGGTSATVTFVVQPTAAIVRRGG